MLMILSIFVYSVISKILGMTEMRHHGYAYELVYIC